MARSYETVMIFDSTLDEAAIEDRLSRFKSALVPEAAESVSVTSWGRRKLAYPIGKKEQGVYMILRYDTDPDHLLEFERLAKLDEQVLRQLTIVDPIDLPAAIKSEAEAEPEARSEPEPAPTTGEEA